jgi:hypothetical protein
MLLNGRGKLFKRLFIESLARLILTPFNLV